jgi:hypothetical protein
VLDLLKGVPRPSFMGVYRPVNGPSAAGGYTAPSSKSFVWYTSDGYLEESQKIFIFLHSYDHVIAGIFSMWLQIRKNCSTTVSSTLHVHYCIKTVSPFEIGNFHPISTSEYHTYQNENDSKSISVHLLTLKKRQQLHHTFHRNALECVVCGARCPGLTYPARRHFGAGSTDPVDLFSASSQTWNR